MKFEMLKDNASIIKVIGVGGGGGNAVNHMYMQGIKGVDFIICNTDAQALENSPIPNKIQLGTSLTEGMGAGSLPEIGKNAAIESIDDVKQLLGPQTRMVFITAGMGGGTGTGASPIIAQAARELDILTVGIVTTPFGFEGPKRRLQAQNGLNELKENVDALLIISNDKLREMYGNLTLTNAFAEADNILATAAKGIAEIITVSGYINVDFKDVRTVMKDSGVAIMGSATANGENRAIEAVKGALASPLLNDNEIEGARYILLNITSGTEEVLMDEITDITDYIQNEAGLTADIIWGNCFDESLGDKISVTLIATGFQTKNRILETPAKKVTMLTNDDNEPQQIMQVQDQMEEPVLKKAPVKQVSMFDFVNPTTAPSPAPVLTKIAHVEEQQPIFSVKRESKEQVIGSEGDDSFEQQLKRSKERTMKLKELNMKLKTPNGLNELEAEPAYKRRKVDLEDIPHSSDSQVSRFTLSEEEGIVEIRPNNNSFLHDNVD